jgi:hypothetical protein
METITHSSFIHALQAAGPDPRHAQALRLYGRFVGSWAVELTDRFPDGSVDRSSGEWHFGWVLQGRAVQDVWIAPPSPRRSHNPPAGYPLRYGTTLRMYLPDSDTWRITWTDPALGFWVTQIGRAEGADIVQEGRTPDGTLMRWSFRDIRPDSFRWLGEASADDGASWFLQLEMRARRI